MYDLCAQKIIIAVYKKALRIWTLQIKLVTLCAFLKLESIRKTRYSSLSMSIIIEVDDELPLYFYREYISIAGAVCPQCGGDL